MQTENHQPFANDTGVLQPQNPHYEKTAAKRRSSVGTASAEQTRLYQNTYQGILDRPNGWAQQESFSKFDFYDEMSEVPSSGTPRLSDISSVDSPQDSLDRLTNTTASSAAPSKPTLSHSATYHVSSGSPSAFVGEDFRRSPDSEALASSDDDTEHSSYLSGANMKNRHLENIATLSSRRPSYAAEFSNRPKNLSIATQNQPPTASADTAAWAQAMGSQPQDRSQERKAALNLTWTGGSIWNPELAAKSSNKARQGLTNGMGNGNPLFYGSEPLASPTSMGGRGQELPIPIPPNPQPRNYRSMSFSVGQRELEDDSRSRLSPPMSQTGQRVPGLQHRPSRPSLLSGGHLADNGNGSPLHSVFEAPDVIDDYLGEDVYSQINPSGQQVSAYQRVQFNSMRLRNRSSSATAVPTQQRHHSMSHGSSMLPGIRDDERYTGEYTEALADEDELDTIGSSGYYGRPSFEPVRRFSEAPQRNYMAENQRLESLKRQHWYSANSAASEEENGSQSRRHSFAGVSIANSNATNYGNLSPVDRTGSPISYVDMNTLASDMGRVNLERSFIEDEAARRRQKQQIPLHLVQQYTQMTNISAPQIHGHMEMHRGMLPSMTSPQSRNSQLLYLVSFKACRADIFYVQEGTGLRVKNGDLVIVEADRGTDLGTVTGENVAWQQAKDLKEQAAQQHFEWLMMFSTRRPGTAGAGGGLGPTPILATGQDNGVGAFGDQQGPDPAAAELKPKMIKRLAQVHEIQTLRDKEANEAKAKRVCQQKVLEHRLPMEILDAEFQMDWKKLTFYYYADSYINFNSLVTDLFKIYKTRIWMSAMNPASFAHSGPGMGPGMLGAAPLDQMPDSQPSLLAMQQQYSNIGQQQYNGYMTNIPRTLVSPAAMQHPLILQASQIPLYTMRQNLAGLVGHDYGLQPQHQQQMNYSNGSLYSGGSPGGSHTNSSPGLDNHRG